MKHQTLTQKVNEQEHGLLVNLKRAFTSGKGNPDKFYHMLASREYYLWGEKREGEYRTN
jgi:hypothetical protein